MRKLLTTFFFFFSCVASALAGGGYISGISGGGGNGTVTGVTGSAPIASSGGNTPNISMTQGTMPAGITIPWSDNNCSTCAATNADNNWSAAQTSQSSWTIKADTLLTGNVTVTTNTIQGIAFGVAAATASWSGIQDAWLVNSSWTITASTFAASANNIFFASVTWHAKTMTAVNQVLIGRCKYQNSNVNLAGTNTAGVWVDGVMYCQGNGYINANQVYNIEMRLINLGSGIFGVECLGTSQGNGTNNPSASFSVNTYSPVSGNYTNPNLDITVDHTIACVARNTGAGGTINYLYGPHVRLDR